MTAHDPRALGALLALGSSTCLLASGPSPRAIPDPTSAGPPLVVDSGLDSPPASVASAAPEPARTGAAPSSSPEVVREETVVDIDGQSERWRLVWAEPPALACVDDWRFCWCFGKEHGERGPLVLVRTRADGREERLALGTLTMPKWPIEPGDVPGQVDLGSLANRPIVRVMKLGDYDHDGRATEMVIEKRDDTCEFADAIVVGVSRVRDELHVFASADKPPIELALSHASDWEQLRRSLSQEIVFIPCGFQGGWPTFEMLHFAKDGAGLHVRHRRYKCTWVDGRAVRGRRILDRTWNGSVYDDH
jgi:hypothetical protein